MNRLSTATLGGDPANLLDSLRRDGKAGPGRLDLIPIWLMAAVFLLIWLILVWLMGPKWWTEMKLFVARNQVSRKNYSSASSWYEILVKENPESTTYHSELGYSYFYAGRYEDAVKQFQSAQTIEDARTVFENEDGKPIPKIDYHDMIGRTYLKLGKLDEADKNLQLALKENRIQPYTNFAMGELEVQRKNYRKAMDYFKVVASNPDFVNQVKPYYDRIEKELFSGVEQ